MSVSPSCIFSFPMFSCRQWLHGLRTAHWILHLPGAFLLHMSVTYLVGGKRYLETRLHAG